MLCGVRCASGDDRRLRIGRTKPSWNPGPPRQGQPDVRTTHEDLLALVAWLKQEGVAHVGMEATGVCWIPVYAVIEAAGGITAMVVDARHIKAVPGRKTDVKDAEWIADTIRHGLVRNSFVPAKPFRPLRDLTRYRRVLVETQAAERQRPITLLEGAGLKLAGVLSDVFGVSGRPIVRALIAGTATAGAKTPNAPATDTSNALKPSASPSASRRGHKELSH